MPIRLLALVLLFGAACASGAPPPKETPVATGNIDVDALARAKDIDAPKPAAGDETSSASAAGESAATEQPVADRANIDATSAPDAAAESAGQPTEAAAPASAPDEADKRHAHTCETLAQNLLDAAQKGDYATATRDFDTKMRAALPAPKLKAAWESLAQFGTLQARGQSHLAKNEGYIAVSVPLVFERANLYAQVACGSDDKIAGFYVKPLEAPTQ